MEYQNVRMKMETESDEEATPALVKIELSKTAKTELSAEQAIVILEDAIRNHMSGRAVPLMPRVGDICIVDHNKIGNKWEDDGFKWNKDLVTWHNPAINCNRYHSLNCEVFIKSVYSLTRSPNLLLIHYWQDKSKKNEVILNKLLPQREKAGKPHTKLKRYANFRKSTKDEGKEPTKKPLTYDEAVAMLEDYQGHVSHGRALRPKAGEIFIFDTNLIGEDWKCDDYVWRNSGSSFVPLKNPVLKKTFFFIRTAKSGAKGSKEFQKIAFSLIERPNVIMVQYIGDESVYAPRIHGNRKNGAIEHVRSCPSLIKAIKASKDDDPTYLYDKLLVSGIGKPRNIQQIRNVLQRVRPRKRKHTGDTDINMTAIVSHTETNQPPNSTNIRHLKVENENIEACEVLEQHQAVLEVLQEETNDTNEQVDSNQGIILGPEILQHTPYFMLSDSTSTGENIIMGSHNKELTNYIADVSQTASNFEPAITTVIGEYGKYSRLCDQNASERKSVFATPTIIQQETVKAVNDHSNVKVWSAKDDIAAVTLEKSVISDSIHSIHVVDPNKEDFSVKNQSIGECHKMIAEPRLDMKNTAIKQYLLQGPDSAVNDVSFENSNICVEHSDNFEVGECDLVESTSSMKYSNVNDFTKITLDELPAMRSLPADSLKQQQIKVELELKKLDSEISKLDGRPEVRALQLEVLEQQKLNLTLQKTKLSLQIDKIERDAMTIDDNEDRNSNFEISAIDLDNSVVFYTVEHEASSTVDHGELPINHSAEDNIRIVDINGDEQIDSAHSMYTDTTSKDTTNSGVDVVYALNDQEHNQYYEIHCAEVMNIQTN